LTDLRDRWGGAELREADEASAAPRLTKAWQGALLHVEGDLVLGDKTGRDKIEAKVSQSEGVAIGAGAKGGGRGGRKGPARRPSQGGPTPKRSPKTKGGS